MSDTCNVCNGRGSLTCNKCDGQGGIRCFKCEGSGYIATPVTGLGDRATWRHDVAPERGSRPCHKCEGKGVFLVLSVEQRGASNAGNVVAPERIHAVAIARLLLRHEPRKRGLYLAPKSRPHVKMERGG